MSSPLPRSHERLRSNDKMAQGVPAATDHNTRSIAGSVLSHADLLADAVRKSQGKRVPLINSGRNRAHLCISPIDAEQVSLFMFSDKTVDVEAHSGLNGSRGAQILKLPQPQVCILHLLPPSHGSVILLVPASAHPG